MKPLYFVILSLVCSTLHAQLQFVRATLYDHPDAAIADLQSAGEPIALIPARAVSGQPFFPWENMGWVALHAPYQQQGCDIPFGSGFPPVLGVFGNDQTECQGSYLSSPIGREHASMDAAISFIQSLDEQQRKACVAIRSPRQGDQKWWTLCANKIMVCH